MLGPNQTTQLREELIEEIAGLARGIAISQRIAVSEVLSTLWRLDQKSIERIAKRAHENTPEPTPEPQAKPQPVKRMRFYKRSRFHR